MPLRYNPSRLEYEITPEGLDSCKIEHKTKHIIVQASFEKLMLSWYQWQMRGYKVQDAFPYLDADEREFLMTGLTPSEWKELFPE